MFSIRRINIVSNKISVIKRWMTVNPEPIFDGHPDVSDFGVYSSESRVHPAKLNTYEQPKVVVIGAGVAGITAAARLAERGITDVTVLEAYERPGGRIYSCWIGDSVAELGAHWRPSNKFKHLAYKMASKENPSRPYPPGALNPRGLFDRSVPGKMEVTPIVTAYFKFKQIEEETNSLYCLGSNKQQGSLLNFMSIRIQQELHEYPEDQQHDVARIMFGLLHMLMAKSNNDITNISFDSIGNFLQLPGSVCRVPLGLLGTLAPPMRSIPPCAIRYCKPVNCVYWGTSHKFGYRALVCTKDGEEFPADYVICTVSIGVLSRKANTMFCPALPASKINALRCLGFGMCNKVYLAYLRPLYSWLKCDLYFFNNGRPLDECDNNWTKGITLIETVPHSQRVICCWVTGAEAKTMECLCDRDLVESITGLLRKLTNDLVPYPCEILRSFWSSDEHFLGAYSFDNCKSNGDINRAISEPVPGPKESAAPILLFAGEATIPGYSATVEGARLSGLREAERIVELTIKYKGPPIPRQLPSKTCEKENGVSEKQKEKHDQKMEKEKKTDEVLKESENKKTNKFFKWTSIGRKKIIECR